MSMVGQAPPCLIDEIRHASRRSTEQGVAGRLFGDAEKAVVYRIRLVGFVLNTRRNVYKHRRLTLLAAMLAREGGR